MNPIDTLLNRVTMYRLVLYYLAALAASALVAGFFGLIPYSPGAIALSVSVALLVCGAANWAFIRAFDAAASVESAYITALIVALIMPPAASLHGALVLAFAALWAIASKYLIAYGGKHIFNPAAAGVALSALLIGAPATWWVAGNLALLPVVLIGGLLVVRKVQRFDLVLAFGAAALLATLAGGVSLMPIEALVLRSSLLYFAFVMLTEPATTPPGRAYRILYGVLVGLLFAPVTHFGPVYLTPEEALLAGNLFAWAVSPKRRYSLMLLRVEEVARDAYDFVFASDRPLTSLPGQYLEWTLPHKSADSRGTRRYFTIASAPQEGEVRLGVKFYAKPSTFKTALANMRPGERLSAAGLAGDFTLPRDTHTKLAFIAGGIGITPFRAMLAELLARGERRDITFFYSVKEASDLAYRPLLEQAARELGVRLVWVVTDTGGALTAERIRQELPDWPERTFYISGPRGMVVGFAKALRALGARRSRIKTDFFPGFA